MSMLPCTCECCRRHAEMMSQQLAHEAALAGSQGEGVGQIPPVPYAEHERDMLKVIDQRDRYHEVADELAARLGSLLSVDIGEHSSGNDPWQNALDAADDASADADRLTEQVMAELPATTPDPAAPDGDDLLAAATKAREVLQQIVASPRHKGPLVSGASAASWALGQALSKRLVGEAVAFISPESLEVLDSSRKQGRKSWVEISNDRGEDWHRREPLYLNPPTAIPDGMVVVPGSGNHKLDTDTHVFFYEQDFYVLSNFSAFTLQWKGTRFDTSEAAYHYEKFTHDDSLWEVRNDILLAPSAHEAFKLAERYKKHRRADWDSVKVGIMREILTAKATQHEYVRRKLLATGNRILVEDSWRDDYWGWGPNRDGQNMLGKLWMEVRAGLAAAPGSAEGDSRG